MMNRANKKGQPQPGYHFTNNEIKAVNTLYGIVMGITAESGYRLGNFVP